MEELEAALAVASDASSNLALRSIHPSPQDPRATGTSQQSNPPGAVAGATSKQACTLWLREEKLWLG